MILDRHVRHILDNAANGTTPTAAAIGQLPPGLADEVAGSAHRIATYAAQGSYALGEHERRAALASLPDAYDRYGVDPTATVNTEPIDTGLVDKIAGGVDEPLTPMAEALLGMRGTGRTRIHSSSTPADDGEVGLSLQ